ncbi:MAG: T9SS type A sorting domain-containing protein [Candidatus Stygibacter frigidus]|nr:T9SS type A sorting domain-containing protein [Candidatus Stygibacter frigidus]
MKKITITLALIIIVSSLLAFGPSKRVYFQIEDPVLFTPVEGAVTFTASLYNATWSGLIIDDDLINSSPGCDYHLYRDASGTQNDIGFITIDCGSFETDLLSLYTFAGESNIPTRSPKLHLEYDIAGTRETQILDVTLNGSNTQVFTQDGEGDWSGGDPLPVTLSSFTAIYTAQPILQWITQSEINNSGWNVYRSNSEDIAESSLINPDIIPGAGTSTNPTEYEFIDEYSYEFEQTYYYWLESVSFSGAVETYGPITLQIPAEGENESPVIPLLYGLHNNYPNPFNPNTNISFMLDEASHVELEIYNIKGQRVVSLLDNFVDKVDEVISVTWDGKNQNGKAVGSGIYFYQLKINNQKQIKKMTLIK